MIVLTALLLSTLPYGSAGPSPLGDDDAGSGTDAGDYESDALPIVPGAYTGRLSPVLDPADWYAFNVTAGQGITARAEPTLFGPDWYLVGPQESYWMSSRRDTNVLADEDATWYIGVESYWLYSAGAGDYGFSLTLVDLPIQNDAGSGRDATRNDPVALPDGTSNATLNKFDTRDQFVFDVIGTELIQVEITTNMTDFKIAWLSSAECCDSVSDGGGGDLFLEKTFTDTTVRLSLAIYEFFDEVSGGDYQITLVRTTVEELPLPDLVITSLVEHRRPITTDFGEAPNNVNERRLIEVEVTNQGAQDAENAHTGVSFIWGHDPDPHRYGGYWYDASRTIDVPAGESRTFTVIWDTTFEIGDYTIVATADIHDRILEAEEENNGAHIYTYVRVGGLL